MTTLPDIKTAVYKYLKIGSNITKDSFTDKFQEPLYAGYDGNLVGTQWISDIFHWRDSIMNDREFNSITFVSINEIESIERKFGKKVYELPLLMRYYIADCLLNIYKSTTKFYRDLKWLRNKVKTKMKSIVYLNNNPYLVTKSFTDHYGNNHVYVRQYAGSGGFFGGLKSFFSGSKSTPGKGAINKVQKTAQHVNQKPVMPKKPVSTPISKPINTNVPKLPEPPKNKWSTAKKIAVGGAIGTAALGAAATYGAYKLAKGTVKTAGRVASGAANMVKQAIPNPPQPVGNAAQANPGAQPQSVVHHHHYGS